MFRTWSAPSMVPKKLRNTLKDKIIKNKDTRIHEIHEIDEIHEIHEIHEILSQI